MDKNSNRVLVSNTKRSVIFYVNLAKRMLATEDEVELSGLGNAMSTVVNVAEILKQDDCVETKKIETSTIDVASEDGKTSRQRRLQIWVVKGKGYAPPAPRQSKEEKEAAKET